MLCHLHTWPCCSWKGVDVLCCRVRHPMPHLLPLFPAQVFFITNSDPMPFWDFAGTVLTSLKYKVVLSKRLYVKCVLCGVAVAML